MNLPLSVLFLVTNVENLLFFHIGLETLLISLAVLIPFISIEIEHYTLLLILVGLSLPFLHVYFISSIGFIILNKEIIHALFLSYILIFSYLFVNCVNAFLLLFHPSSIFLSHGMKVSKDEYLNNICKKLAEKIGIRAPKVFLSSTPEIYVFGRNQNNAAIVLYEKCNELGSKLEPILLHEMTHIKSDVKSHSLFHLLEKEHSFGGLVFLSGLLWVSSQILLKFGNLEIVDPELFVVNSTNFLIFFVIMFLPFFEILFFKLMSSGFIMLKDISPELDEFKADLATYLIVKDKDVLIDSLSSWRKLQTTYMVKNLQFKNSVRSIIKELYNKFMQKKFYSKEYVNWLEYFTESISKLMITFQRGFDFPKDRLRVEFIEFIDKMVNENIAFNVNPERKIELGIWWEIKTAFANDSIGLYGFVEDLRHIPSYRKKMIINYLLNHLNNFNATACSVETNTSLY